MDQVTWLLKTEVYYLVLYAMPASLVLPALLALIVFCKNDVLPVFAVFAVFPVLPIY